MEPRTQTSVGMETVDETVNRARQMQATNTDIPVEAIENNAGGLEMPQVDVPQDTSQGAMTSANQILTANEQRATAERDAQATQVDEGERAILEGLGVLGTQRQTRNQLEDQMGLTSAQSQMADIATRVRDMVADMADRDDDFAFGMEEQRQRMGARDGTKREFGNFSAEMNLRQALDRRSRAAEVRAATAAYHIAEGNYNVAARQVQTAMDDIYEPVKTDLQMQQFMLQQNMQRLSSAQQETAQARMMSMTRQLQDIDYARDEVSQVVKLGFASGDEIEEMMKMKDPFEQIEMARSIHGRGAAQERAMDMEMRNAQLAQIYHSMAPEPAEDPNRQLSINELEQLNSMGHNLPVGSTMNDAMNAGVTPGVGTGEPSDFARMVIDNPSLIKDLTPTERGNVYKEIASAGGQFQTQAQQSALRMQREALKSVEDILADEDAAFGGFFTTEDRQMRAGTGIPSLETILPGSGGRQFRTKLDTLKAQMELPNLEFLAGMGRMSQEQFRTLQRATSNLDSRNLSNAEMRRQLNLVRDTLQKGITEAEQSGSSSLPQQTGDDDYQQYLNTLGQ